MGKSNDFLILPLRFFDVEDQVASQLFTFGFWMGSINFFLRGALSGHLILPFEFLKGKLGDYPILFLRVFDGENWVAVLFSS